MRLETGWPWGGALASARTRRGRPPWVEARRFSWQALNPKPLNPKPLTPKPLSWTANGAGLASSCSFVVCARPDPRKRTGLGVLVLGV